MIDSASISSPQVLPPTLKVVPRNNRLRDRLDRKRTYFFVKRLCDIVFSSVFLICVLSWLVPLLAILIKLSSRGPVFFLQKRVGRGGRSFTCYKFRTMIVNDEADTRQALEKDNRITRLGWFLRKTNMDEFPQFLNILKGDMSIIGPRPHMYADCKKFSSLLPGYKYRNLVKPGLTGLAQIKGYHGPASTEQAVTMRFYWDKYYITQIGFWLDLTIFLSTIFQRVMVIKRSLPAIYKHSVTQGKEEIMTN